MWKTNLISILFYPRDFINFVTMYKVVQGGYLSFNIKQIHNQLTHKLFKLNQPTSNL